jgi:glycerophosphoryl diester phosphodiesterase
VRGPRPENTIEAFRLAFEEGLDGIETDVQRTADGHLILFHDFELADKRIDGLSLHEVQLHDPEIPELEQLFDLARAYPGTLLNLELKADRLMTRGLEQAAVKAIRASGLASRIIISSFHPASLCKVRLLAPELRTGLLYSPDMSWALRSGWLAGVLHVDALHPHESQVTKSLLARAKQRGLAINTWTVNEPMRIKLLWSLKVDAIIGDDPTVLRQSAGHSQAEHS